LLLKLRYLVLFVVILYIIPQSTQAQGVVCQGTPPSFIHSGVQARVTITPSGQRALPLRVRSEGTMTSPVIAQLTDGTVFFVIAGPTCADGFTWWQISVANQSGWVAEGDASGYFIEPITQAVQSGAPVVVQNAAPTVIPTTAPTAAPLTVTSQPVTSSDANRNAFAAYNPGQVDLSANVPPYQVAPDFSNVIVSAPLPAENADLSGSC
jgi:hypothetical protein